MGKGRTCRDSLRPMAYSSLAELIHNVRASLSRTQLSKVVYMYSRNLHDLSLPFSAQTMSAKLLQALVEVVEKDQQGKL